MKIGTRTVADPSRRAEFALARLREHAAKVEGPTVHGHTVTYTFDTGGTVALVGQVTLGATSGRLLGSTIQAVYPGHTGRPERTRGHADTYRALVGLRHRIDRARREGPRAA